MMGEKYEYRFRIDAFTPASMPMAHLAEYMRALAAFLGYEERVHFVCLEEGSTVLVQEIEPEDAPKVQERIESVRRGDGPADALRAFEALDHTLAQDNAVGFLYEPDGAEIIQFPGRERPKPVAYGSFRQRGSLDGYLVRIGGTDQMKRASLKEGDVVRHCKITEEKAYEDAAPAYLEELNRSARFRIATFDTRAAVELAALTREALDAGDKRDGSTAPWQKIKIDRQIIAIARTEGAAKIYSDDDDIQRLGQRSGIEVIGIAQLPLPPEDPQAELPI